MQQKEYESLIRQSVPVGGQQTVVIENTGLSKLNFHGMRFMGRIIGDVQSQAEQFQSGYLGIMCIPNDQITIPTLLTEADLNDSNSFIIAVKPWMTYHESDADNTIGAPNIFDFEIVPLTSRSCMKGGKIVGFITNNSAAQNVIVEALLSTFETF